MPPHVFSHQGNGVVTGKYYKAENGMLSRDEANTKSRLFHFRPYLYQNFEKEPCRTLSNFYQII